jgi:uncharacterized protein DUF3800
VFQCYLDDSGTSGLPIVTMAGFMGSIDNWQILEPQLDAILNRYDIKVFHSKEFHDTKGPFAKWSKIKKRSLVEELFATAHGRIHGYSMSVRKRALEETKKKTGRFARMSSYGVCFSVIMTRIIRDQQIAPLVDKHGISFLVESGNKNNQEIEQFYHRMSKQPAFGGALRSLSFVAKDSCRAIQLADLFAFYSRRHMRDADRFTGQLYLPLVSYLQIIQERVPVWQDAAFNFPDNNIGKVEDIDGINAFRDFARPKP